MTDFNLITALLGAMVLLLAAGSTRLAESPVPPTLVALAIGIAVGPQVLGLLDLSELGNEVRIREAVARLALGIGLMGVALRIPPRYWRENWRGLTVLTGVGMLLMWAISTLLVYLFLDLPLAVSALIGAIITPTDPVAASPVVTGKLAERHIPGRVRHAISFDSGANDGLGYLFVFLPLLLLTRPDGEALSRWLTHTLLQGVVVATGFGLLAGWGAGKLLRWSERRGSIQTEWRLVYTVALALAALGAGRLMKSDEVLIVFAAGAAFAHVVGAGDRETEDQGQEAVNRFFAVPIFALFGMALPWAGWAELGWRGVLLAAAVLLLRRPPVLVALLPLVSLVRGRREALFIGWFGPIAVAAIYYASIAEHRAGMPVIWHVVSLVVFVSVLAHSTTSAPFTRRFGRAASTAARKHEAQFSAGS